MFDRVAQRKEDNTPRSEEEEGANFEANAGRCGLGDGGCLFWRALLLSKRPVAWDNEEEVLLMSVKPLSRRASSATHHPHQKVKAQW